MKNTIKSITTICFFFTFLSCENKPISKTEKFFNSGKVFSYVNYTDEMIVESYIRDSLETIERDSLMD